MNKTWEVFFLKNHTQNLMEKLFPDYQTIYWKIKIEHNSGSKFYVVCFYFMASWGPAKYIATNSAVASGGVGGALAPPENFAK